MKTHGHQQQMTFSKAFFFWDIRCLYRFPFHWIVFSVHSVPDSKVHGAHLGPTGPRWAPWWPCEPLVGGWGALPLWESVGMRHGFAPHFRHLDDLFAPQNLTMSTIFTRGQFWPSGIVIACVCVSVCPCVYQSLACPHDNSSAVHARITKFGWETQNTLVKRPIIFGGDRPWPSR